MHRQLGPAIQLLLMAFIVSSQVAHSKESTDSTNIPFTVSIHVRYASKSSWTAEEIKSRLARAAEIFKKSCNIEIQTASMIELDDPGEQDMPGGVNANGVRAKLAMRKDPVTPSGPVLLYVRNGFHEESPGSNTTAQAYMLGDSASPGNLFLTNFYDVRSIHGTIVISDRYSLNSPSTISGFRFDTMGPMDVDAHEIGHILLNDAGHNSFDHNIMSYLKTASAQFNKQQCKRMRTYHDREKTLFDERERELAELCSVHEKARKKYPTVCEKALASRTQLGAPAKGSKLLQVRPKASAK